MPSREEQDAARRAEAEAALKRVERESEVFVASSLARTAGQVRDHFSAADAEAEDAAELWGKRIARLLALGAVLWLLWHLVTTYLVR